nr:MAG TPA: hypothetical protein [Caudoviricetes sp.]
MIPCEIPPFLSFYMRCGYCLEIAVATTYMNVWKCFM